MRTRNVVVKFVRAFFALLIPLVLLVSIGGTSISAFASSEKKTRTHTVTFLSVAKYSGWVVEDKNTDTGLTVYASKLYDRIDVGDTDKNNQMKGFLSFNTWSIPNTATITSVQLKVRTSKLRGFGKPFTHLGGLYVDVKKPAFEGNICCYSALEITPEDFEAPATKMMAAQFGSTAVSNWYSVVIPNKLISKIGYTQFRLHFLQDDNNNEHWDFISFSTGLIDKTTRPQLIVTYE